MDIVTAGRLWFSVLAQNQKVRGRGRGGGAVNSRGLGEGAGIWDSDMHHD